MTRILFSLLFGFSILAGAAHAQPVETFEYTVVTGDSCGRIAQRFYGAWRRYDVILRFNPRLSEGSTQQGACGPYLRPGVVLTLPRVYVEGGPSAAAPAQPATPEPDARVTRTFRDVEAAEPDARAWQRARRGLPLWRGWRVNTLERSAADVTFRDASRIALRENTLVVIYGGEAQARRETARATLERGQLRSRLAELRMQVETPSARAELAPGSALVGVDEQGTTRLSNFEGEPATVRGERGRVAVGAGFGSKVARGARPSRPRPLPPAPTWSEGPRRFVGIAPYGATVTGAWAPVEVARRYRVEIVDGEGDVVAATEVPSTVTRFELHRFPEGSYRVRVSTIDGDFFESRPSEARAIEVALGRLDLPTDDAMPDPSEEPTPPVVVLGARFDAPAGTRCALGEGEPHERLALATAGLQPLRCVDAEGHPTGAASLDVRAPTLTVEHPPLTPGARVRVVVRSDLRLAGEPQLRVGDVAVPLTEEDGAWSATLDTGEATGAIALAVTSGDATLWEATATVGDATPDGAAEGATDASPSAATEASPPTEVLARPPAPFSIVSHPDLTALRDAPGDDLSIAIGIGSLGDHPADDAHLRLDASVAGTIAERVRLMAGIVRDFAEVGERLAPRGDGDVRFELDATSRFEGPWRVGGGVGLLVPTGREMTDARTLDAYRLGAHVDLDYLAGALALRTRQSALLDLGEGLHAWASTYGASWRLHPQVDLGAELQLTIGRDGAADELAFLTALGLGAEARFGGAAFTLAARVGLGEDTRERVGTLTLVLGWRVSFDETMP